MEIDSEQYSFLYRFISTHGLQICHDKRRMKGIIYDIFPHSSEIERNVLIYALEDGIVEDLLTAPKDDTRFELCRMIELFSRRRGLKESLAVKGILHWAILTRYINEDEHIDIRMPFRDEKPSSDNAQWPSPLISERIPMQNRLVSHRMSERIDSVQTLHPIQEVKDIQCEDMETISSLIQKGGEFRDRRNYENALICCSKAIKMEPSSVDAWRLRGMVLVDQGNLTDADDAFTLALSFDPFNSALLTGKAILQIKQGRYPESLKILKELLRREPDNNDAWVQIGRCYQGMGRYQDAIDSFQRSLGIIPEDRETWYHLGTAYEDSCQFTEAIRAYDEIIRLNPRDKRAWHNKGKNLMLLNRTEEAKEALRNIRQEDKSNP